MPEVWEYREPQGRPQQHPPTERVPWQASRYDQTEHIDRLQPWLPGDFPAAGHRPSFNPGQQQRSPADDDDAWGTQRGDLQPARQQQPPQRYQPPRQADRYAPPQNYRQQQLRKTSLTAFEQFWYILGNISFGAMYFAKIPAKKAMHDFGLVEMTAAEKFWYVLMCFPMGAAYFLKIPVAKAITEMQASGNRASEWMNR